MSDCKDGPRSAPADAVDSVKPGIVQPAQPTGKRYPDTIRAFRRHGRGATPADVPPTHPATSPFNYPTDWLCPALSKAGAAHTMVHAPSSTDRPSHHQSRDVVLRHRLRGRGHRPSQGRRDLAAAG